MKTSQAACAVLAGGRSERMGQPKAGVRLANRPLIEYPLAAAISAGLEPAVVAKPDSPLPALGVLVVREPPEPRHPLCGIVAALREFGDRPVVVVGCDMPFVPPELLAHLAALDAPLAVCEAGGRVHPLLARYTPGLLPALQPALGRGDALQSVVGGLEPLLLGESDLARFGDPARVTFNVNDLDDLAAAEAVLEQIAK